MSGVEGIDWVVTDLVKEERWDGDTFRACLVRVVPVAVHSDFMTTFVTETASYEWGVPLRLTIVDTPDWKDGREARETARIVTTDWLKTHFADGGLGVTTYGSGGMDRYLADVYPVNDRQNTLTQHLLLIGYPPHPDTFK